MSAVSQLKQGRSLWLHRGCVPNAIYRYKYHNKRYWGKIFASELAQCYGEQIEKWKIDTIIPVPLHPSRKKRRGFNQAEIIAGALSEYTGIPVVTDVLFRIRKTVPQKNLGRKARKRNMQGAFGVSRSWIPSDNILLIDDIYTTGSTMEKAAYVLHLAGVQNVYFLTLSIGQGV